MTDNVEETKVVSTATAASSEDKSQVAVSAGASSADPGELELKKISSQKSKDGQKYNSVSNVDVTA